MPDIFGTTPASQTRTPYAPTEPHVQTILGGAQQQYERAPEGYQGSLYAGLTQPQQQATTSQIDLSKRVAGGAPAVADLASRSLAGEFLTPESNPYLQQYIQTAIDPVTQAYREQVMPAIGGQAIQAGGYGGSRQGVAEALASREYMGQVGDISSNLAYQNYLQERGIQVGAGGQLAQGYGIEALAPELGFGAGTVQQQDLQAQLEEQARKEYYAPQEALTSYAGAVYPATQFGGTTTMDPGSDPLAGLMGAGLMAYTGGLFDPAGMGVSEALSAGVL